MTLKIGNVKKNQINDRYIYQTRVNKNKVVRQKELGHYRRLDYPLKRRIRERDNYTCQMCGKYSKIIDHIVPWRISHDNSESNLRILCRDCNTKIRLERRDSRLPLEEWYQSIKDELDKLSTLTIKKERRIIKQKGGNENGQVIKGKV